MHRWKNSSYKFRAIWFREWYIEENWKDDRNQLMAAANFGFRHVLSILTDPSFVPNLVTGEPNSGRCTWSATTRGSTQMTPSRRAWITLSGTWCLTWRATATTTTAPLRGPTQRPMHTELATGQSRTRTACGACVSVVFSRLVDICAYRWGGQLQAHDRRVRLREVPNRGIKERTAKHYDETLRSRSTGRSRIHRCQVSHFRTSDCIVPFLSERNCANITETELHHFNKLPVVWKQIWHRGSMVQCFQCMQW